MNDNDDVSPWPTVSVIMPVLNEERHLADAVRHILGQDYPGELEIVIALGPSSDRRAESLVVSSLRSWERQADWPP